MRRWSTFSADLARATAVSLSAVFGVATEHTRHGLNHPDRWVPDFVVGLAFVVAGSQAFRRRQGAGSLLALTGMVWWLANLIPEVTFVHRAVLIHLLAAYPGWRVPSRVDGVLLAAAYAGSLLPAAGSEAGAIIFAAVVVGASLRRLGTTTGTERRMARGGLRASLLVATGSSGGAILRMTFGVTMAQPGLWLYQFALASSAVVLATSVKTPRGEAIADLVVELDPSTSGTLRDSLARLLEDPMLQVGFQTSEGQYRDNQGHVVEAQSLPPGRVATVIEGDRRTVIIHRGSLLDEAPLLEGLASAATLSTANAELNELVRTHLAALMRSRERLASAEEEERRGWPNASAPEPRRD